MLKPTGSMAGERDGATRRNRRKWVRHTCGPEVSCRLILGAETVVPVDQIQNLSAGGVNLVLDQLIPTGKILMVELRHALRQVVIRREARVTYLFRGSDGRFTLGGAFAWELGTRELEQLLDN